MPHDASAPRRQRRRSAPHIKWRTWLLAATVSLTSAGVGGIPEPATAATIGHSIDTFWTWPQPAEGLWRIEQDVAIQAVTVDTEYFWAEHVWWAEGYSLGGYVGLQSRGQRRADNSIGDTAIFSVWQAVDARGPACGRFVEITTGYSCSLAYEWRRGATYRYVLERTSEADETGTWWTASIIDLQEGARSEIGEIKVRAPAGAIEATVNFTEYFGAQERSCARQPYALAHFSPPRGSNDVGPTGHSSERADPDCRVTEAPDGGVIHEVGDPALAPPADAGDEADGSGERAVDDETSDQKSAAPSSRENRESEPEPPLASETVGRGVVEEGSAANARREGLPDRVSTAAGGAGNGGSERGSRSERVRPVAPTTAPSLSHDTEASRRPRSGERGNGRMASWLVGVAIGALGAVSAADAAWWRRRGKHVVN